MKHHSYLLSLLLVACLMHRVIGISLPSFLGGLTTKTDSESQTSEEEVKKDGLEHHDKRPTTYRPPLLHIPHPADSPLNPANNPNHPLHPENRPSFLPPLPHLPGLSGFPHFTRETIRATKTVFVEVTDRVTVHPVCMTTHKVTPPCLPYNHHQQGHGHHQGHYHHRQDEIQEDNDAEVQPAGADLMPQIQPTKAAHLIEPTVSPQFLEPTRILGGVSISEGTPGAVEEVEEAKIATGPEAREGRYVEITPLLNTPEEVEIKDEPEEPSYSPINMVQNLLQRSPVTHYKTKTLWVTKVEKVLDTRVTATLLAKNCVPTNSHIPLCAPHGGLFSPGYHGYLGEGTFSENFGGNFFVSAYKEKEEEGDAKGEIQEQRELSEYDEEIELEEEKEEVDQENQHSESGEV